MIWISKSTRKQVTRKSKLFGYQKFKKGPWEMDGALQYFCQTRTLFKILPQKADKK